MGKCHCSVPGCNYGHRLKMRKSGNLNFPKEALFGVRRPDLAKTPEEKQHRQNLTDALLAVQEPDKVASVKFNIHRESASICERHFLAEDLINRTKCVILRMGAIPVLHMPKLTDQMRMRLKLHELKQDNEKIFYQSVKEQTEKNKSEMKNNAGTKQEQQNIIIMPQNGLSTATYSKTNGLVTLKERMWSLMNTLKDFCLSLLGNFKEETLVQKFWNEFYDIKVEFFRVKEFYEQDQNHQNGKKLPSAKNNASIIPAVCVLKDNSNLPSTSIQNPLPSPVENTIKTSNMAIDENLNVAPNPVLLQQSVNDIMNPILLPNTSIPHQNLTAIKISEIKFKHASALKSKSGTRRNGKQFVNGTRNNSTNTKPVEKRTVKAKAITAPIIRYFKRIPNNNSGTRILKWATKEEADHYKTFCVPHPEWKLAYKCNLCDRMFRKWHVLRRHDLTDHTKVFLKPCSICKKRVRSLKSHMLSHTKERKFSCNICGAKFIRLHQLKSHIAQLTACRFPSFQCNICGEKFNKEEEYGNHFKEKHLNKKIICDLCGDEVCEKCVEDKHQVTLLKLYKCKFCQESFMYNKEYSRHIKENHIVEACQNGVKCPQCPKIFPFRTALASHVAKCHKQHGILCEYCPKVLTSTITLNAHIQKKHSN